MTVSRCSSCGRPASFEAAVRRVVNVPEREKSARARERRYPNVWSTVRGSEAKGAIAWVRASKPTRV